MDFFRVFIYQHLLFAGLTLCSTASLNEESKLSSIISTTEKGKLYGDENGLNVNILIKSFLPGSDQNFGKTEAISNREVLNDSPKPINDGKSESILSSEEILNSEDDSERYHYPELSDSLDKEEAEEYEFYMKTNVDADPKSLFYKKRFQRFTGTFEESPALHIYS